jgi:hypothetical protein
MYVDVFPDPVGYNESFASDGHWGGYAWVREAWVGALHLNP